MGLHKGQVNSGSFKKGVSVSPKTQFKKGLTPYNKGKKLSVEQIKKLSLSHKGKPCKNGFKKGVVPWNKGLTKEIDSRVKQPWLGKERLDISKENHYNWQNGKSFEPYSVDWSETLKRSIRERDRYVCQLCGLPQGEEALNVHHIDYNKLNCNPDNLISLHRNCHTKTNHNRSNWIKFFTNLT
jgi:5-methylcytosine-specific restriction endonuclease McrA